MSKPENNAMGASASKPSDGKADKKPENITISAKAYYDPEKQIRHDEQHKKDMQLAWELQSMWMKRVLAEHQGTMQ